MNCHITTVPGDPGRWVYWLVHVGVSSRSFVSCAFSPLRLNWGRYTTLNALWEYAGSRPGIFEMNCPTIVGNDSAFTGPRRADVHTLQRNTNARAKQVPRPWVCVQALVMPPDIKLTAPDQYVLLYFRKVVCQHNMRRSETLYPDPT